MTAPTPLNPFAQTMRKRFVKTYCSQCGGEFDFGESGFSHCSDHEKSQREWESIIWPLPVRSGAGDKKRAVWPAGVKA